MEDLFSPKPDDGKLPISAISEITMAITENAENTYGNIPGECMTEIKLKDFPDYVQKRLQQEQGFSKEYEVISRSSCCMFFFCILWAVPKTLQLFQYSYLFWVGQLHKLRHFAPDPND